MISEFWRMTAPCWRRNNVTPTPGGCLLIAEENTPRDVGILVDDAALLENQYCDDKDLVDDSTMPEKHTVMRRPRPLLPQFRRRYRVMSEK
jgi:hypothetical protein